MRSAYMFLAGIALLGGAGPVPAVAMAGGVWADTTPASVPAPPAWSPGSIVLMTPDGAMRISIGGRVQARYEYASPDAGEDLSSFYLRRVRIDVRGTLLDGRLTFRIMPELARSATLRDGWVGYAITPMLQLRAGQFVVPFHWLRFVSGNRQHFAERGVASETHFGFPGGYDIGVGLHGRDTGNRFAYGLGLFDGAGRNVRESNSAGGMASARATWAVLGVLPHEEPDLAYSRDVQLSVGAGLQGATLNEIRRWDLGRSETENARADWAAATGDLTVRWRGLSVGSTAYVRRVIPDDPAVAPYTGWAHVASAGYFVVPHRLELVGRHTRLMLDRTDHDTGEADWGAGVNIYHFGHNLKTQVNYMSADRGGPGAEQVLLVQLQLLF